MKIFAGMTVLAACFSLAGSHPASAAPKVEEPPALLSPAEAKELDAVFDAMVPAGFPDTRDAHVYVGTLSILATFDPTRGAPPFPPAAAKTHMLVANSNNVTEGYLFSGLHFKLVDGSWLVALRYHFSPKAGDVVDSSGAHETQLANLVTDAVAAHPINAAKEASDFLVTLPEAERPRAIAALDRGMPVMTHVEIGAGGIAPATVLLHRAGWNEAEDLALVCTGIRACAYWEMQLWGKPDQPFDPTSRHTVPAEERKAWAEAQKHITLESPATAMRRAIFEYCRGQIVTLEPEERLLTPQAALAVARATVDPKDSQHNLAKLDALAAAIKLPFPVEPNASLELRLQSWEEVQRPPRKSYIATGHGLAMSDEAIAPPPAYTPRKEDLDALVALLVDERPSRFWDFFGPRTVGDNALRALATLLNADPRALAGYPTDKPWTAAERQSAAKAVQAWWKAHRKEFAEK